MAGEALAAVLVGVAALWLVLQPLIKPRYSRPLAPEPLDPEETPKGIALTALKEIEFDRETGKLSQADYEFLKAKYTATALDALRSEQGAVSNDVEALIAARVRSLRFYDNTVGPLERSFSSGAGPGRDSGLQYLRPAAGAGRRFLLVLRAAAGGGQSLCPLRGAAAAGKQVLRRLRPSRGGLNRGAPIAGIPGRRQIASARAHAVRSQG
jgi:hypothetical protein